MTRRSRNIFDPEQAQSVIDFPKDKQIVHRTVMVPGGADRFRELLDTPGSYLGQAKKILIVAETEDEIIFEEISVVMDDYILKTEKGEPDGVAPLNADARIETEYLPENIRGGTL